MKKIKIGDKKKIKARFICALTIYWPNGKLINSIAEKLRAHISA